MSPTKKEWKDAYRGRTVVGGVFCIRCGATGERWLHATDDLRGSRNRFSFSVATELCPEPAMADSWKVHGPASFTFEVLEELEKKESQTDREFAGEIEVLLELWREKLKSGSV